MKCCQSTFEIKNMQTISYKQQRKPSGIFVKLSARTFNKRIYFNNGFLKDADTFSLIDDVLNEEYAAPFKLSNKNLISRKPFSMRLKEVSGKIFFSIGVKVLFALYYITHLNYRAR